MDVFKKNVDGLAAALIIFLLSLNIACIYNYVLNAAKIVGKFLIYVFNSWSIFPNELGLADVSSIYMQIFATLITVLSVLIAITVYISKNYEKLLSDIMLQIDLLVNKRIDKNMVLVDKFDIKSEDLSAVYHDASDLSLLLLKYEKNYANSQRIAKFHEKIGSLLFEIMVICGFILFTILVKNNLWNPITIFLLITVVSSLYLFCEIARYLQEDTKKALDLPYLRKLLNLEENSDYITNYAHFAELNKRMFQAFTLVWLHKHTTDSKKRFNVGDSDRYYLKIEILFPAILRTIALSIGFHNDSKQFIFAKINNEKESFAKNVQYISLNYESTLSLEGKDSRLNNNKEELGLILQDPNSSMFVFNQTKCIEDNSHLFLATYRIDSRRDIFQKEQITCFNPTIIKR